MRKRKYQGVLLTVLLSCIVAIGSGGAVNAETQTDENTINLPYVAEQEPVAAGNSYSIEDKHIINLADDSADELNRNSQLTDQAGLLTEPEELEIEEQLEKLADKTGWEVMVVTTDDAEGMSATNYAESWLDAHMTGDDGIIYLIDMDNREIVVSRTGKAINCLTDAHKKTILDVGYEQVSDEEYAKTFRVMIQKTSKYAYRQITVIEAVIVLIVALAAGGITVGGIIGSYRLKFGGYKYPIEKNGSVNLRRKEDTFVNQFVTHRHIPKSDGNSGGGKTTTHSGAGGRTYSSGSRKF